MSRSDNRGNTLLDYRFAKLPYLGLRSMDGCFWDAKKRPREVVRVTHRQSLRLDALVPDWTLTSTGTPLLPCWPSISYWDSNL